MFEINDVIKVLNDFEDNIKTGDIGTVVHTFNVQPPVYEIEFTDDKGRTLVTTPLKEEDMSLYWDAKTGKLATDE